MRDEVCGLEVTHKKHVVLRSVSSDSPLRHLYPDEARLLALMLIRHAGEADGFPGTKEDGEYFIDFNTQIQPGKIQAVRVRIDLVTISDMETKLPIDLRGSPLFKELKRYVDMNS